MLPSNINFGALVVLNDPKAEKHFIVGKSFNDLFGASSVVGQDEMINGGKFFMTNAPMYTPQGPARLSPQYLPTRFTIAMSPHCRLLLSRYSLNAAWPRLM